MGTHPIFESDFDCLTEKKMTSTLPSNVEQLSLGGSPWLRIHILTTQNSSAITEQKFDKSLTVGQFKGKLELITGYNSGSMKLSIESVKGDKLGEMDDNQRLLGSYQIDDGMAIRASDPEAIDWNSVMGVEKQEMDDDTYDTFKPTNVKPTVREYKRIHKLGKFNPGFQKKAQADWDQQQEDEKAARERIHKGDRCEVTVKGGVKHRGCVRFLGEAEFKPDQLWVGVQLDEPFGKNNGSVGGVKYFECGTNYGMFVKPDMIECGDFPEQDELDFSDDEI